jgi:patatin-related protein
VVLHQPRAGVPAHESGAILQARCKAESRELKVVFEGGHTMDEIREQSNSRFELQLEKELRFALVMYGGVSLAIYINGVAQEFYSLVRATAEDGTGNLLPPQSKTEETYRKLASALGASGIQTPDTKIRSRFVVDILSGTSAGGINAVFLAKALAQGQDFGALETLWIHQADISMLLNDKHSGPNPAGFRISKQYPPESVLDSGKMYALLLSALDRMEENRPQHPVLVQEVDLFVTTTDLAGLATPLTLADQVVFERRHRAVFRFRRSPYLPASPAPGQDGLTGGFRDDFRGEFNPFLAFAGRCTSAFPVAFEPTRLKDIDPILQQSDYWRTKATGSANPQWQRFLDDYVAEDGQLDRKHPPSRYPSRAFADGGYLNNKPFSYAIEELGIRGGDLPYERKLVYIEPSPETMSNQSSEWQKPDAIANALAASLTLPRYQTIGEDLRRVTVRNHLVQKIQGIIGEIDNDIDGDPEFLRAWLPYDSATYLNTDLTTMVNKRGALYAGYHRLKIKSVTEDLTRFIVAALNLDEASDDFRVIYYLVWAWRSGQYSCDLDPNFPQKHLESDFLLQFDGAYRERRWYFVQHRLDTLYGLGQNAARVLQAAGIHLPLPETGSELAIQLQLAIRKVRGQRTGVPDKGLVSILAELRLLRNQLLQRGHANPLSAIFKAEGSIDIEKVRGSNLLHSSEDLNRRSAEEFLRGDGKSFHIAIQEAMSVISKKLGMPFRDGHQAMQITFPPVELPETFAVNQVLPYFVRYFYDRFDFYDAVAFPITYGTDVGILKTAEVHRVSPQDATSLINELDDPKQRRKLAGDTLFAFGSFFQRWWRENDVMWGRLDGAERIITMLLTGKENQDLRSQLIEEAHLGIIEETMSKVNFRSFKDAIVAQFRDTGKSRQPDQQFAPLTASAQPPGSFLTPGFVRDFLRSSFSVDRTYRLGWTLPIAARSVKIAAYLLYFISKERRRAGRSRAS